jgi:hypothetical protein
MTHTQQNKNVCRCRLQRLTALASPAATPLCHFLQGRWQQGGLADGLSAFGGTDKYGTMGGEAAKPTYTTVRCYDHGTCSRRHPNRCRLPLHYAPLGHNLPPAAARLQADVGLGPKARDDNFGFANDKPAPLQLERIDEDVTLRGVCKVQGTCAFELWWQTCMSVLRLHLERTADQSKMLAVIVAPGQRAVDSSAGRHLWLR